jgi:hypothetical protein
MLESGKTALERAFELAKSGRCRSLGEIRLVLAREGYDGSQLQGIVLAKQLRNVMLTANKHD